VLGNVVINRWVLLCKLSVLERYITVVAVGRGVDSGYVALCVQYEGSCLTCIFKWCVGGVNSKLD
jgi:hypothetical protein